MENTEAPESQPEAASKERFFRYFQQQVTALQEQIERIKTTAFSGSERNDAIDDCLAGIDRLSHEAKDASSYIPAYDQRTYGEAIKALGEKLQETRSSLAPPKKFKFSSARKNNAASSPSGAAALSGKQQVQAPASTSGSSHAPSSFAPREEKREEEALAKEKADGVKQDDADPTSLPQSSASNATTVQISDHTNAHILQPPSASHTTSSGTVSSITHSVIDLSPPPSSPTGGALASLILKDITESLIVCGRVDGPAHITGVQDSVLVVSCRQFRMHSSRNVTIYLHSSSRPIIEDCAGLRFAPLPAPYADRVTATATPNHWDQIDDFKWLKLEPSPNFRVLREKDDWVQDTVWTGVVAGRHGVALDGILKAVGVIE